MAHELKVGVSGWNHIHWGGQQLPGARIHPLEWLSDHFDVAEVKESFDEYLKPEVTRVWLRKVKQNKNFQFTFKLHREFTHERLLDQARVERWKSPLMPVKQAGRLGAVLMQFPWSFRFTKENRDYLIQVRRAFHDFPLVAEFRHESWMMDEALGTLIDYKVGFCNIDQPEYERSMPPTKFLTSAIGYVRLHGRNSFGFHTNAGLKTHRYDYQYSDRELLDWVNRIDHLRTHSVRTFVVANNDQGAKAARTAMDLQDLLGVTPEQPVLALSETRKPTQAPMFGGHRRVA
jgi:uncharacterized protein YecE (DUF72 family)